MRAAQVIQFVPGDDSATARRLIDGWIVGWDPVGGARVEFPGNGNGPLPARSLVPLSEAELGRAASMRGEALLAIGADGKDAIIMGLVHETARRAERVEVDVKSPDEAVVDGRRILLRAGEELVLRCGDASVSLFRDGRVVVRGTDVHSRATGQNRVTGGSVKLN